MSTSAEQIAPASESSATAQSLRPDGEGPELSVIVVTHNRAQLALDTLAAAFAAARELPTEWFVVDSGSSDGTPEAIEAAHPDLRVERLANVGFAAANNVALAQASGRYVLLLNPDCVVREGDFRTLIAALDARPEAGIASVIQVAPSGDLQHSIRHYPSPRLALGEALGLERWFRRGRWREEETRRQPYDCVGSVDWLVGAFLIARADAIREVGFLDDRFFLYAEELDWCYRFRQAGWDVCHLPAMTVTHHTGAEVRADLVAQLSYAKILFARKHYKRPQVAAIRVSLAMRHAFRALAASLLKARRQQWSARAYAERHALAVVLGRTDPPFGGTRL